MRKNALIVVVIGILFLGTSTLAGINAPLLDSNVKEPADKATITMDFLSPTVQEDDKYALIVKNTDMTFLLHPDAPQIPYTANVMTFPFGTTIENIEVTISDVNVMPLEKKIKPAPTPLSANMQSTPVKLQEGVIYAGSELYPSDWVTHSIGVGLDGDDHVMYLSVYAYPYRYLPMSNELWYTNSMVVEVSYELPEQAAFQTDAYDLIIIAPSEFSDGLQPLIDHKEAYGLQTKLVTLSEIYGGTLFTAHGRDEAEQIKYFIKDAVETWGTTYVLLVGGRHGGITQEKWWCPVRYAYLDDGSDEDHYLCDLYFSDIYKYDGEDIVFDDWDSNSNGIYAEWRMLGKDIIDMFPDVYVGRLACRNTFEVDIMVEKIITYETTAYGQTWANRFVGVAGDTYPNVGDPYYEGELATEAAFGYLDGFEAEFLWTSTGTLSDGDDIINAVSQGCGFLHFSGHGNPMSWANHPPNDHDTWIGIDETQFMELTNDGMYPVSIVGGCHNNQFNISLLNLLKLKNLEQTYYHSTWGPECWGWWLARAINAGSIATIANSGYGYGQPGEDCLEYRGRYMELQFFKSYGEGKDMLGETHASGLTYYLQKFPPLTGKVDSKIVQQWVLLGDPSLKIGGYP